MIWSLEYLANYTIWRARKILSTKLGLVIQSETIQSILNNAQPPGYINLFLGSGTGKVTKSIRITYLIIYMFLSNNISNCNNVNCNFYPYDSVADYNKWRCNIRHCTKGMSINYIRYFICHWDLPLLFFYVISHLPAKSYQNKGFDIGSAQ